LNFGGVFFCILPNAKSGDAFFAIFKRKTPILMHKVEILKFGGGFLVLLFINVSSTL
jgi:hypothetical protein